MKILALTISIFYSIILKAQIYSDIEWGSDSFLTMIISENINNSVFFYDFVDSLSTGNYRLIKNDTVLIEATFKNYKKNGIWKYYYLNGKIKGIEHWELGKKNGEQFGFHKNGVLNYFVFFKDGEVERCRYWYDENGNKTTERCLGDSLWIEKEWNDEFNIVRVGNMDTGNWVDGIWKYYDKNGELIKEEVWDKGKLIETKE